MQRQFPIGLSVRSVAAGLYPARAADCVAGDQRVAMSADKVPGERARQRRERFFGQVFAIRGPYQYIFELGAQVEHRVDRDSPVFALVENREKMPGVGRLGVRQAGGNRRRGFGPHCAGLQANQRLTQSRRQERRTQRPPQASGQIQARCLGGDVVGGHDQHDLRPAWVGEQRRGQLQAAAIGHQHVQQHDIGVFGPDRGQIRACGGCIGYDLYRNRPAQAA